MREGSSLRRTIATGKAAMRGLTSIRKDRGVTLAGDEGGTSESFGVPDCSIRNGDLDNEKTGGRKIDAFELWCWRRVLKVSWMERKTTYGKLRTSNQNGDRSQGCQRLH